MKRRWIPLLAVLVSVVPPVAGSEPDSRAAYVKETREYLSRLERLGFAGAVLVAEKGEILLAEGYGWANREASIRWTPETVSDIGSITKQFTAAAVMALEEAGKLHVEDSIAAYFPNVPEDKQGITLHHLLTHTSGIVDVPSYDDFDPVDRDLILKLTMEAPLASPPGEQYEYSNAGFSLLGLVVERVSGTTYEPFLKERLLEKAGLHDTGYQVEWDSVRVAQGYRAGERWGTSLERPWDQDGPYWILRANGGIHSTCRDMLRWAQALLDDRVLRPESRAKLWTPYADEGGGKTFYGYGWSVITGPDGRPAVTHSGGNSIFFADLGISPETGQVIFLMTNVAADFPRAGVLLTQLSGRLAAGTAYPILPDVIAMTQEHLEVWAGTYRLTSGGNVEVQAGSGRLQVIPEGKDAWRALYTPTSTDTSLAGKQAVVDRVVGGILRNDYRPQYEAYGGRVPLATLEDRGRRARAELEQEIGAVTGHEVLGSAPLEQGTANYVRLDGVRGARYRQYVWTPEGVLRGYRPLSGLQVPEFFPVAPDRFQAWGSRLAVDTVIRFEKDAAGSVYLVLGEGDRVERLAGRNPR